MECESESCKQVLYILHNAGYVGLLISVTMWITSCICYFKGVQDYREESFIFRCGRFVILWSSLTIVCFATILITEKMI